MEGHQESTVKKGMIIIQIRFFVASPFTDKFPEIWSSSSSWYTEGVTLKNGDFTYKYPLLCAVLSHLVMSEFL